MMAEPMTTSGLRFLSAATMRLWGLTIMGIRRGRTQGQLMYTCTMGQGGQNKSNLQSGIQTIILEFLFH